MTNTFGEQYTENFEQEVKKIVLNNLFRAGLKWATNFENMYIFKTREEAEEKLETRKTQMIFHEMGVYVLVVFKTHV